MTDLLAIIGTTTDALLTLVYPEGARPALISSHAACASRFAISDGDNFFCDPPVPADSDSLMMISSPVQFSLEAWRVGAFRVGLAEASAIFFVASRFFISSSIRFRSAAAAALLRSAATASSLLLRVAGINPTCSPHTSHDTSK
jgi:hypothetical protein